MHIKRLSKRAPKIISVVPVPFRPLALALKRAHSGSTSTPRLAAVATCQQEGSLECVCGMGDGKVDGGDSRRRPSANGVGTYTITESVDKISADPSIALRSVHRVVPRSVLGLMCAGN